MKKRIMKAITKRYHTGNKESENPCSRKRDNVLGWFPKLGLIMIMVLSVIGLPAQVIPTTSGGWDGGKLQGGGFVDYGNGVIQLLDDVNNGCEGAAVHESSDKYNPCTDGNFSKCYQVLFGCEESGADGLAFTFSSACEAANYEVYGCGGGLGYLDAWCGSGKGITIEFDTFDNEGVDDFDSGYEGTGVNDQVAIHKNLAAKTAPGKVTGAAVGQLEDGQEHRVCINYDATTHILSATIDGVTAISYDLDLAGLELSSYFGGCMGLNQTWSAGTNGAFNKAVVSNGANIYNNAGAICPGMLPVEFLNVQAQTASSSVIVSWSTATEESNEKFLIERSNDLSEWEAIGEVTGAGNSTSVINYSFTDYEPLNGTAYYRIRQVDFDGVHSYSNVVAVNKHVHHISIGPNPFEDVLTISSDVSGDMDIKIHDVVGRLWYHTRRENENGTLSIQPELSPGTYVISIQTETFIEQRKVIKK